MTCHFVIPDTQVKPGVPLDHLTWAGEYIVEHKPDVIVHLGDFADMPSLSSYDVGKKSFEGRRYRDDVAAAHAAMDMLLKPLKEFNERARRNKEKQYNPRRVILYGNHEDRITRATNSDPKLDGTISLEDLGYARSGWETVPYLEPIIIDGTAYCHYFTSGILGKPVTSATALLAKKHMSCVMGHVQTRQIAYANRADGKSMTGLFAGSFYQHDEDYLNFQGNQGWRGCWMLYEVNDGSFDECPISLTYLRKKYGGSNGS